MPRVQSFDADRVAEAQALVGQWVQYVGAIGSHVGATFAVTAHDGDRLTLAADHDADRATLSQVRLSSVQPVTA